MDLLARLTLSLKYRLGILCVEDQLASLYYMMNNCIDITKLPKTCNSHLRLLQKCDVILLAIFDKICSQEGLNYWLDYGSLLGAVRHGGVIPWDDDIDVSMPRKDYSVVCEIVTNRLSKYNIEIIPCSISELRCYQMQFNYAQTGICIDIFSSDQYYYDGNLDDKKNDIAMKIQEYRRFFLKNSHHDKSFLERKKNELFDNMKRGERECLVSILEGYSLDDKIVIEDMSSIFPLKRVKFEDFWFAIPSDAEKVLCDEYGFNYMHFPKIAINNHGIDANDLPPVKRAETNGVDMERVYADLMAIYNSL